MLREAKSTMPPAMGQIAIAFTVLLALIRLSDAQVGTTICGCQPATYTFTLDFGLKCVDTDVEGPGINETACLTEVRGQDEVTDEELIPVVVQNIQIFELDQNKEVFAQTVRTGTFLNGSNFTYTSILSTITDELNPTSLPRGLQLVITGLNSNEDAVVQTYILLYTNDCGIFPILTEGQQSGWTIFSDLGDPPTKLCPLVPSSAPTFMPTIAPSTMTPTVLPTESPTESPTHLPTESPTVGPTESPTSAPIVPDSPTRAPATISPTVVEETASPTQIPETASPTQEPETTSPTQEPETTSPTQEPRTSAPVEEPVVTEVPTLPPNTPETKAPETNAPFCVPVDYGSSYDSSSGKSGGKSGKGGGKFGKSGKSHSSDGKSGKSRSSGKSGKSGGSSSDGKARKKEHDYYGQMERLGRGSRRYLGTGQGDLELCPEGSKSSSSGKSGGKAGGKSRGKSGKDGSSNSKGKSGKALMKKAHVSSKSMNMARSEGKAGKSNRDSSSSSSSVSRTASSSSQSTSSSSGSSSSGGTRRI